MSPRAFAAGAAGALLLLSPAVPAASRPTDGSVVIASAYGRNESLHAYTFALAVHMRMRHFPWLRFHMDGTGTYERGQKYVVHFTNAPRFAGNVRDIDLSIIDPSMWPGRYRYTEAGERDGDTLFALAAVDDASLKDATVALNPNTGAHWADVHYTDGTHIHMTVGSVDFRGFLLPVNLTADVDYSGMPLAADARFSDYSFSADPGAR